MRLFRRNQEKSTGQTLVEFAIVLPVLLTTIFTFIEIARLFHAWLAVENGARMGVRYAVTGEYDNQHCIDMFGADCSSDSETDQARVASIQDAAWDGSVTILRDVTASQSDPGFFKTSVCTPAELIEPDPSDPMDTYSCSPSNTAGGPGDSINVAVDFNHPVVVPFISNMVPVVHLRARREAVIEQFRTSRVVVPPGGMTIPTTAPPAPTATNTATNTATATQTYTPTLTPTPTMTLDCSLIYSDYQNLADWWEMGYYVRVRNDNPREAYFTSSTFEWTDSFHPDQFLTGMDWDWSEYYGGNDYDPPTSVDPSPPRLFPANSSMYWAGYFWGLPYGPGLGGEFTISMMFDDICPVVVSATRVAPTLTITPTPDCANVTIYEPWITGDDIRVRARNGNPMPMYLVDSSLVWPSGKGSMYLNYTQWDWTTYDSGNYSSSPTIFNSSNEWTNSNSTETWRTDFSSVPYLDGVLDMWGYYDITLVFEYPDWGTCTVSADLLTSPEPTNTPSITPTRTSTYTATRTYTITRTPTITPTYTVTNTPTETLTSTATATPDCDDLAVNSVRFSGDDFEFRIWNQNDQPGYISSTTLYWPAASYAPPMSFNYFRYAGNLYYGTDSSGSPVTASGTWVQIGSDSNEWWETDFNNMPGVIEGNFSANLTVTFPGWGTCALSGSYYLDIDPTNTPVPVPSTSTNTPIPTNTPVTPTEVTGPGD